MLQKYRGIIIVASVVAAALIGWVVYREFFTFYLKNTSPDSSSVSYSSPYLKLNFNKNLKTEGYEFKLTSGEGEIYVEHEIIGKTFKAYLPTSMEVDQTYTISLENISATDGKVLSLHVDFTTKDIPYSDLDKEQQDELIRLQDALHANDDPIVQHLPHGTLDYTLSAFISSGSDTDVPGDRLKLQAKIVLSNADIRSGRDAAIARIKNDIAAWITSVGLDPASYNIEYTISDPLF